MTGIFFQKLLMFSIWEDSHTGSFKSAHFPNWVIVKPNNTKTTKNLLTWLVSYNITFLVMYLFVVLKLLRKFLCNTASKRKRWTELKGFSFPALYHWTRMFYPQQTIVMLHFPTYVLQLCLQPRRSRSPRTKTQPNLPLLQNFPDLTPTCKINYFHSASKHTSI